MPPGGRWRLIEKNWDWGPEPPDCYVNIDTGEIKCVEKKDKPEEPQCYTRYSNHPEIELHKQKKIKPFEWYSVCPECGSALAERKGPYGEFIGCSKFPVCKFTCGTNHYRKPETPENFPGSGL